MQEKELDLPESLGTTKCYDCGIEPRISDNFWEKFIEYQGKIVSVPQCNACSFIESIEQFEGRKDMTSHPSYKNTD